MYYKCYIMFLWKNKVKWEMFYVLLILNVFCYVGMFGGLTLCEEWSMSLVCFEQGYVILAT